MSTGNEKAFLGVERSLRGKRWRSRLRDEQAALLLSQRHELPDLVARVLAARGVGPEAAERFLHPKIRDFLPDPSDLLDMDHAVERVVAAINSGETIGVFADYDVDGAAAAAILVRFFASLGRQVSVYVPDRIREGYGPNAPALLKMKEQGVSLVITVDCGTTAFTALDAAAEAGLDVIVVDHHVPENRLPEAVAVINPNRHDESSPLGYLCAAGVAFMLVVAVNRALRQAFWFGEGHREPDLMGWLDLVALATVADVVPLVNLNRAFVRQGLAIMSRRQNPGLVSLGEIANLDSRPEAQHLAFQLGPRVNAGGRVGEAGLGVRLLTTQDRHEADRIARRLDTYNAERREIEAAVLEDARSRVKDQFDGSSPVILVAGEGWHPGVIGIVASRLKDEYDRPVCVIALNDGLGKGSGRSVRGVDLGRAVIAAHHAGLIPNGGGHAMAAGFSVGEAKLGDLRTFFNEHVAEQMAGRAYRPELEVDGALQPEGASLDLIESLQMAGPFGSGNPVPRFAFPGVTPAKAKVVGNAHVRCFLASSEGGRWLPSIAFRCVGTPVGDALLKSRGAALHVAGQLKIDTYPAEPRPQLIIADAALVGR